MAFAIIQTASEAATLTINYRSRNNQSLKFKRRTIL
jgi:hypothetical protein